MNYSAYVKAAKCLKTIAHPHRLKMIKILLEEPSSVKTLAEACKIRHNVASEHLSVMKDRDLLSSKKEKTQVIYKIKEKALSNILKCVETKFKKEK